MKRSTGIELDKVWDDMHGQQKHEVLMALFDYEKALCSADMPMYGSLYYPEDLPSSISSQKLESTMLTGEKKPFAVGPTTNRAFFDDGRDTVETHQGPCMLPRFVIMSFKC